MIPVSVAVEIFNTKVLQSQGPSTHSQIEGLAKSRKIYDSSGLETLMKVPHPLQLLILGFASCGARKSLRLVNKYWKNMADISEGHGLPDVTYVLAFGDPMDEWNPVQVELRPVFRKGGELRMGKAIPTDFNSSKISRVQGHFLYLANEGHVERWDLAVNPYSVKTIDLGYHRIHSIYAVKNYCYVGMESEVHVIDFSVTEPTSWVVLPQQTYRKPVDDFALCGNRLVAVDDCISPKFAFVFSLDEHGAGIYKKTCSLPEGINEQIVQAEGDNDDIVLMAKYSHRGGSGQRILTGKLQEFSIQLNSITPIDEIDRIGFAGSSEYQRSAYVGSELTWWKRISIVKGFLLIAAQSRGILYFPLPADGRTKMKQFKCGNCMDVLSDKRYAYALAQQGNRVVLITIIPNSEKNRLRVVAREIIQERALSFL